MSEFMGVRVDPVDRAGQGELREARRRCRSAGQGRRRARPATSLDGRLNDSVQGGEPAARQGRRGAARRQGAARPAARATSSWRPARRMPLLRDDRDGDRRRLHGAARPTPKTGTHDVKRLRVGMYQRYCGGNIDEGWTRFLLEQFAFPYTTLMDAEIKKGGLERRSTTSSSCRTTRRRRSPASARRPASGGRGGGRSRRSRYPPEYRSGIGADGVAALKAFVQKGGTLVTLGGASTFAIERFGLPVRNVRRRPHREGVLVPGLDAPREVRHDEPAGLRHAGRRAGRLHGREPGVRDRSRPTSTSAYEIVVVYAGARPAPERLAHRRGDPGEEGGDGLGEARRRPRGARSASARSTAPRRTARSSCCSTRSLGGTDDDSRD